MHNVNRCISYSRFKEGKAFIPMIQLREQRGQVGIPSVRCGAAFTDVVCA